MHLQLAVSIYPANRIRHSNQTLSGWPSGCLAAYLPVLSSRGLSHHSVLNFWKQNPSLSSICGYSAKLDGRELIINTQPHLSWHETGICEIVLFSPEEHRKRLRRYDTTRLWESAPLRGSPRIPSKSDSEQKMPNMDGQIHCMIKWKMKWDNTKSDASYLRWGLLNLASPSLRPSPLPGYPCMPLSPSLPLSSCISVYTP